MTIPSYLKSSLASYNVSKLDIIRDKDLIITEVLNKGDENALMWIVNNYSKNDIKQVISSPIRGLWLKKTLRYWLKIFDVKLDKKVFSHSILNLNA